MKGIVFTKFIEMVEERFSQELADDMIDACDLPNKGAYTSVGTYDHRELVAMVLKLADMTGQPVPALLKAYGHFLFGQFAKLYPSFFVGVDSATGFVSSIENVIHVEVKKLYPDAELPRFETLRHEPGELVFVYRSDRHFGDLAEGLLEACIEHFGESGRTSLERADIDQPGRPVRFTLRTR